MTAWGAHSPYVKPTPVQLADFFQHGWAILPDLMSREACQAVKNATEAFRADPVGSLPIQGRTFQETGALVDAHVLIPEVGEMALEDRILEYLEIQFGLPMQPVATLNFSKAKSMPPVALSRGCATIPAGWSCGLVIALEDMPMKALTLYSGTHAWPELPSGWTPSRYESPMQYLDHLLAAREPDRIPLALKAGCGLLIASNLLYAWDIGDRTDVPCHLQLTSYIATGAKAHVLEHYSEGLLRWTRAVPLERIA